MELIPNQRHLFDLPRNIAYLNCAYKSPLLNASCDAAVAGLARQMHPWTLTPTDFFMHSERARKLFAQLIHATENDIALIPAVSYGMAVAARNLPLKAGQTIVLPAEEFPSGVYAWREAAREAGARIVTVPRPANGDWTSALLEAIDADTAVVCTSHTHWVCGGLVNLQQVSDQCRKVGAALVLDVTQSCGAQPLDVQRIDPDFVVAANYKYLLGPYTTGFLYAAPRHQMGSPLEQGWIVRPGAEDFRRVADYRDDFQPGARRFDMGERANFALIPAVVAALEQLIDWQVERTQATLRALTDSIVDRVAGFAGEALPAQFRSAHYLGIRFTQGFPEDVVARFATHNVYLSVRGDRLRVTPHLYNDEEDMERFFAALQVVLGAHHTG